MLRYVQSMKKGTKKIYDPSAAGSRASIALNLAVGDLMSESE